jgi:5-methylcytosine-specific restriction endonuclease McrA
LSQREADDPNNTFRKSTGQLETFQFPKRNYPAHLIHQLSLRDQRQCTGKSVTGGRCTEERWLEFHHVIPVEQGGPDTLENLRTLCWAHHKKIHSQNLLSDQSSAYVYEEAV